MPPILYEDDDIIAVDKPAGVASIPERDRAKETVPSLLEKQLGLKAFIVHRLDKEVSGVMLFAKNPETHRYLNEEFFNRNVCKTYCALVHGALTEEKITIDKPIRLFGSGRMGIDEIRGKRSLTRYEVIKRYDDRTLIHAYPLTGRRHQIRVHLYSIGHPIVGDLLYGDMAIQKKYPRLMLHSESIRFKNSKGKEITVESKVPEQLII
jgi:tRNA pseudouridine32 synthase/23S rRNA pseudouridine746 synthase